MLRCLHCTASNCGEGFSFGITAACRVSSADVHCDGCSAHNCAVGFSWGTSNPSVIACSSGSCDRCVVSDGSIGIHCAGSPSIPSAKVSLSSFSIAKQSQGVTFGERTVCSDGSIDSCVTGMLLVTAGPGGGPHVKRCSVSNCSVGIDARSSNPATGGAGKVSFQDLHFLKCDTGCIVGDGASLLDCAFVESSVCAIVCSGSSASLHRCSCTDCAVGVDASNSAAGTGRGKVSFQDLHFTRCGQGALLGDLCTVSDCSFCDCSSVGVACTGLSSNVCDSSFSSCAQGVSISSISCSVHSCDFSSCPSGVVCGNALRSLVTACSFHNCTNPATLGDGNAFGPICAVAGVNNINAVQGAAHPQANFVH